MCRRRWLLLLVSLVCGLIPSVSLEAACWCGGCTLNFMELDTSPFGSFHTIKVPNDTLTNNGDGTATFAPSGSGNVSNSGTPTSGQACEWVNATTIQGVPTTGTGNYVRALGPDITWGDGLRQTFNPNATNAGLNVGSHAGDPSTPVNGDLWYDSTANELTARINGANVALGAGGAGGAPTTAQYWTAQAEAGLSAEVNLGALTTGLLKHTVSGGISTPATAVVNTDYVSPASAASWGDGVKQTFNPNATNAGLNVGSQAGDPSSLANGDLWYDSTANELTARINGANVALGAAGAGGVTLTGAETLSNKKVIPRKNALSAASGTVTAPNCDVAGSDTYFRDDIAGALTIPAFTGTCHDGQRITFELKPATTPQTVTFTTGVSKSFSAQAGPPLPTTTGDNATYVLYAFVYKATTDRFHYAGGTKATAPLGLPEGGTGAALGDPGGHRLWGWDDTDGAIRYFTIGGGLDYNQTTDTLRTTKYLSIEVVPDATALTTGDGKAYYPFHPDFDTWQIVGVSAHVGAAVSSSGVVNVDIDKCGAVATGIRCSGTNVDVLSTNITIDANEDGTETAAAAAVIDLANDDIATGQWLRFNIDAAGTGTQGLYVTVVLRKP